MANTEGWGGEWGWEAAAVIQAKRPEAGAAERKGGILDGLQGEQLIVREREGPRWPQD